MKLFTLALVSLLAADAFASGPVVGREGTRVTLVLPTEILAAPAVRKRLSSGLTTTFLVEVQGQRRATIGVRRDLWEESWVIEIIDQRLRTRKTDPAPIERIWSQLLIDVAQVPQDRVQIAITVYPFSDVESEDTRSWLSQSTTVDPQSPPSAAIDAVIRTAIRARPVYRRQWTVPVEGVP